MRRMVLVVLVAAFAPASVAVAEDLGMLGDDGPGSQGCGAIRVGPRCGDAGDTAATAKPIPSNLFISGGLMPVVDARDYYAFGANATDLLSMGLGFVGGHPDITLISPAGIRYPIFGGWPAPEFFNWQPFTAGESGRWLVEYAEAGPGSDVGNYGFYANRAPQQ